MFYDNLKSICDSRGLKITTVVTECGGALGSIGKWKKGASPNSDIVIKLSLHLGVTTDFLLKGFEEPNEKIGINNQSPTITNSNNVEFNGIKHENNIHKNDIKLNDNTKELVRIFESLPVKEQIRLMNIVYDYEEQYRKSHT